MPVATFCQINEAIRVNSASNANIAIRRDRTVYHAKPSTIGQYTTIMSKTPLVELGLVRPNISPKALGIENGASSVRPIRMSDRSGQPPHLCLKLSIDMAMHTQTSATNATESFLLSSFSFRISNLNLKKSKYGPQECQVSIK